MTDPGTVRPGGRTAQVRESVLRTVGDMVADRGFDALELPVVAERAGVGKTTLYRRWGSASALVSDLLVEMAASSRPRADTGSLRGDLTANAALVVDTLGYARQGRLFRAMFAAAAADPTTAEALATFYAVRVTEWAPCVDDAILRGEAPAGTDAHEVIRAVSAPLYYRFLTTLTPPDGDDADRAVAVVLAAVAAGAFTA
ncbi:TetR family transcriptional regulator [Williamsia sp. Leaf354]|nr:TetR/AcrR family transcriptional regulator [Williamsia sp. Leaf354]KQR95982.1 TetR family transcriptional regulator [Williamsia sp. Leaf354]